MLGTDQHYSVNVNIRVLLWRVLISCAGTPVKANVVLIGDGLCNIWHQLGILPSSSAAPSASSLQCIFPGSAISILLAAYKLYRTELWQESYDAMLHLD